MARINVHVHPRAARPRKEWDGHTLQLWVTEPPAGGAANDAVVRAVASWVGGRRADVRIVTGKLARDKVVEIDGLNAPPPAPSHKPAGIQ